MDDQGDLWNVYVLLQMEKANFKLIDLLLDRGNQLVPFSKDGRTSSIISLMKGLVLELMRTMVHSSPSHRWALYGVNRSPLIQDNRSVR